MRAPDFWWQPRPNILAWLLRPLGLAYGAITAKRMRVAGLRMALPVICIGNFVIGGAGKTPTALAIARRLMAQGEKPIFLSRGYRAQIKRTPCLVNIERHTAADVGDEALLLARVAPTIIGGDRVASARLAEKIGATLLILDDGLHNPALVHDLRLAIVDATTGIGNGLCVPAGPLRAPLAIQLAGISAVVLVQTGINAEEPSAAAVAKTAHSFETPLLTARFAPEAHCARQFAGQRVVAFAGIGLPRKLKATLLELGALVVGWRGFPDHHVYSSKELRKLQTEAAQKQALLVTTEKDFVRILPFLDGLSRNQPWPLALAGDIIFTDETALDALLMQSLREGRTNAGQPS